MQIIVKGCICGILFVVHTVGGCISYVLFCVCFVDNFFVEMIIRM